MTSLTKTAIPTVQPAGYWGCQLTQDPLRKSSRRVGHLAKITSSRLKDDTVFSGGSHTATSPVWRTCDKEPRSAKGWMDGRQVPHTSCWMLCFCCFSWAS
ncbi:hypothetical protein V5799_015180 [Amblyomma americanum]|uniref:Uncharacterized protein n=1 Tax=Amblyomma americanum TaxID=6943 RepID=A0AAQ4E0W7_AMBAM